MTIRNKLALRFMLLASLILGVALLVVYLLSSRYRIDEFSSRMVERGANTAILLLQVEEVDQALLRRMEKDSPAQVPGESIKIFDPQGREIFSSGTWQRMTIDQALLEKVSGSNEVVDLLGDGEAIGFPFLDQGERFVVLVSGSDRFGRSKLRNLGKVMLVTYGVGVLITFIVGRIYAQRALEPLKKLVSEVGSIHEGNLLQRVDVGGGHDEIAQLATSFNELLGRLEMAFNSQRNFIANASHELRTPLTVISGQLEVLLLMERSSDEYRSAVASILEDMLSMNRLANRLLMLAQADNTSAESTFAPVRIDEVIWQVRTEYLIAKKDHMVDVTMNEVEDEHFMQVSGNENLLRSLVHNLIENGCKYSSDHRVEVRLNIENGSVLLSFSDRGIGIPAEDGDRIFSPFFRGRNTAGSDGHGIGLSLVHRITELHKGGIRFADRPGGGTVFTATLPHL